MQVESKVGQGTRMYFSLKFKLGNAKDIKDIETTELPQKKILKKTSCLPIKEPFSKPATQQPLPAGCPQVLFVEDNIIAMKAGQAIIQNEGCQVYAAKNAEAAIKLFKNQVFDLVISDLGLSGFQGDEMTSAFRYWKVYQRENQRRLLALPRMLSKR